MWYGVVRCVQRCVGGCFWALLRSCDVLLLKCASDVVPDVWYDVILSAMCVVVKCDVVHCGVEALFNMWCAGV